jgi:hypothetical protein
MTRTLFVVLLSLILVGCTSVPQRHYVYIENFYGEEAKYVIDDLATYYSTYKNKKSVYQPYTTNINNLEDLRKKTMAECRKDWTNYKILEFSNLEDGCIDLPYGKVLSYEQSAKRDQYRAALKRETQKAAALKAANEKKINEKNREEKIAKLDLKYADQCKKLKKGSPEFESCLFEKEKLAIQEQNKLANMPPSERYAYTCEKTYGFRKGTDNFKECVFKIMTTEYEMQNQLNQRRIAELERKVASNQANTTYQNEMLEIERMKAKAMQDQVNFARNKDVTDTLLGISNNLLNPPRRSAPNAPQMFNCQTRKFGGFDQIQCF